MTDAKARELERVVAQEDDPEAEERLLAQRIREGGCELCGSFDRVKHQPPMTCYADPASNETGHWCHSCRHQYEDYWEERWADYHSGLL